MAEEVRITYDGGKEDERVSEWEVGLPGVDDLTPLSQSLISSELSSAFNITPEPYRSMIDVNRASQSTLLHLRGELETELAQQSLTRFKEIAMAVEGEETAYVTPDFRKIGGGVAAEETESDDPSTRVLKRPRLVWTPQLHKRFIEVVAHLGVKNALPKTIMQLMNVEGLTRENVASHLQKYRMYLKRMQSLPTHGSSSSDHLFFTTLVAQSFHHSGGGGGRNHPPPAMVHHMPHPSQQTVPNPENFYKRKNNFESVYHHGNKK